MNVYTCNDLLAVIVAENEEEARRALLLELEKRGLEQNTISLIPVNTNIPLVRILHNGNS